MKLSTKLILITLVIALLPFLVAMTVSIIRSADQVKKLTTDESQLLAINSAEILSQFFSNRKSEISILANSPTVKTMDWEKIGPYYRSEQKRLTEHFEKLLLGTLEGEYYNTAGGNSAQGGKQTKNNNDPAATPSNIKHRDYWQVVTNNNQKIKSELYVSDPMISMSNAKKQVMVASGIINDGMKVGMTSGGITWETIENEIKTIAEELKTHFEDQAKFCVVTHTGTYAYHWLPKKNIHIAKDDSGKSKIVIPTIFQENIEELKLVGQKMLKGEKGYSSFIDPESGQESMVFYAPIKAANYSLAIFIPTSYLMSSVQELIWFFIILGIVVLVIVFVSSFLLSKKISKPINSSIDSLNYISENIANGSNQVAEASNKLAEGSSVQASSIEEISASINEMSAMLQKTSEMNLTADDKASSLVEQTDNIILNANRSMAKLKSSMEAISQSSEETGKIIKVIDEIAFQTNLLSLNAAVEAARAGEAGMGFAVVANEVRNLAQRSAEAAKTTAEMIDNSIKQIKEGFDLAQTSEKDFGRVVKIVNTLKSMMEDTAHASKEQAIGIEQINQAVSSLEQVTHENASSSEETAAASEEMSAQSQGMLEIANGLMKLVGRKDRNQNSSFPMTYEPTTESSRQQQLTYVRHK